MSKSQDKTKVTRITASDAAKPSNKTTKSKLTTKTVAALKPKSKTQTTKRSWGVLGKIGGYFKGAWFELRQVHWPTRQATWGLTGAVLLFSAFFVLFITLLDVAFKFAFEQILKQG